MEEENIDVIERVLADANQKNVTLIADGLTKQHFIELEPIATFRGELYEAQIKQDEWAVVAPPPKSSNENDTSENLAGESAEEAQDLFSTELNDKQLNEARSRLASRLSGFTGASMTTVSRQLRASMVEAMSAGGRGTSLFGIMQPSRHHTREYALPKWYLNETAVKIKEELSNRGNEHYDSALIEFNRGKYEKALVCLGKAFLFNSLNIQYYLLRYEIHIRLRDFKSALLTINKLMAILALYTDENDSTYDELRDDLLEKTIFCFDSMAQACYDAKNYLDAYESYVKIIELKPDRFEFRIKSINCLCEMNRGKDALTVLDQLISENEESRKDVKLYVLRAEVNIRENEITKAYYDLKEAINLDATNEKAGRMMNELKENADRLRNSGVILGLNNRIIDGIIQLTQAINHDPENAEYHLQRGVLFKRRKDFNSAIDDFLLGIDKLNKSCCNKPPPTPAAIEQTTDTTNTTTGGVVASESSPTAMNEQQKQLMENFKRQVLLTYNDFSIQCYEKGYYDDAIVLLDKAIKTEKNEKGFYVNRGDCFYKKKDKEFALLDYEQAHELDRSDQEIKNRIARIHFEYAIDRYNEKDYESATSLFDKAIKFAPGNCKYYISRARTLFFSNEKLKAQVDICVAILLDPSNQEIPAIISRLFVNNDLNEVMECEQMKFAKTYLDRLIIQQTSLSKLQAKQKSELSKPVDRPNKLQPSLSEVLKEEAEIKQIIDEKKRLKHLIKDVDKIDIKEPERPKLRPVEEKFNVDKRTRSKEINWRRFKSGIGSSL